MDEWIDEGDSPAALAGTDGHSLLEREGAAWLQGERFVGEDGACVDWDDFEWGIQWCLRKFVALVREFIPEDVDDPSRHVTLEGSMRLTGFEQKDGDDAHLWMITGTPDVVICHPSMREAAVIDYKLGWAQPSPGDVMFQALTYAAMVLQEYPQVERVTVCPLPAHHPGLADKWRYTIERDNLPQILHRIKETIDKPTTVKHAKPSAVACQFCAGRFGACGPFKKWSGAEAALARLSFVPEGSESLLPSPERFARVLEFAAFIRKWADATIEYAKGLDADYLEAAGKQIKTKKGNKELRKPIELFELLTAQGLENNSKGLRAVLELCKAKNSDVEKLAIDLYKDGEVVKTKKAARELFWKDAEEAGIVDRGNEKRSLEDIEL